MLIMKFPVYYFKQFLKITIFISLILCSSCQEEIILPHPCTEEANLPFTSVLLRLSTDVESSRYISVDYKGHIYGDSIIVVKNNLTKSANIAGYICDNGDFYLNAFYNDPAETGRIKIEGSLKNSVCGGQIFYCSNLNNNCEYFQIGYFTSSYSGTGGRGTFTTLLISGAFTASFY